MISERAATAANAPTAGTGERDTPPESRAWRCALTAGGWLLSALGALGLFAWALGEQDYLQIEPGRPPLHYNGTLGFVLWGAGYLALVRGRNRVARGCAGGLFLIGALVLLASVPGAGLPLDRWAFTPSRYAVPAGPGGSAPSTGAGFCLAALAIGLGTLRGRALLQAIGGTLIGAVLVLGAPALLVTVRAGGFVVLPSGPSVLGIVGVWVGGLALLASGVRRGTPAVVLGHAVPLAFGGAGAALTVALWLVLDAEQDERMHRQVQFETAHIQRLVMERVPTEMTLLVELAERWPDAPADGPVPEPMKLDAGNYLGQIPGCLGVACLDAQRRLVWIESGAPHPATFADLGGGEALAGAVATGQFALVRPPRSCWRGQRVMLLFAPGRAKGAGGGMVSAISVQQFYANVLNANAAAGYGVTISEGDEEVFTRYGAQPGAGGRWSQSLPITFRGREWRLTVWPTPDALARENLALPKLALLVGLLTTGLLALAAHLAQTARRRTFALENEVRERQLAERAMRQSEEKYRTLIENLGQGIFLQDHEHRYVAANAQFCKSVGRAEAEVIGATELDLYDPDPARAHTEEVRTVLADGRSVESESEVLVGERRTCVRRVLTPVRDATGRTTGVLGICWDVTEQRKLEAHVHQASKMDAIGQLAGGIAHDFNNLLTVILGNLEMMLADLAPGHPDHGLVVSAQSAAVRAAALTQRLLGFSRRHQLDWRPTNLNGIITEVVALLQRTIDPLTRIETHLGADLWAVQADPTQLNQVLMNLCINARDAIGGAGRIAIETSCAAVADGPAAKRGDFVRLRVTDTGAGMAPEVKARIYEPFFTTKDVGKGTGLGLAMVFAIVRQHKGWIDCHSEVGTGTRFDIYLPRGEAVKAHAPPATPAPSNRAGKETVLVVDDEELIRKLAVMTLQSRGYCVLQAADGREAVELYAKERDRIDLVLLDLTMPVLSGHEAFRQLLGMNPRVKVLFASGYAVEQLSDLEKERMAGFVKKPYRPNELVLAVEDALPRRGGSRPDTAPTEPDVCAQPVGAVA
ncbi:response regulator [Gemmata sp. G18]|uniref:histidine kinase n=1 Tax=Gemmata palustris TaxID=2822762 RepID=A0ABS5C5D1_9BACT|nr:ATP-binding protein [Gemmata palustris]MBP3960650.1 response regulator [Gemmata palustris]